MPAYKPYLKLKTRTRRKIQRDETPAGEFFFSDDVADSPCEAAFYIVPHKSAPMFKVGWSLAADRRLDTINEVWGNQLDIYSAIVIATSRKAAVHAERTMKLLLDRDDWKIGGLPPLDGYSEFFSSNGLLYAYDKCMKQVLPMMESLEARTHVITARGADQTTEELFRYLLTKQAGKSVSADELLANMIRLTLRPQDIPKIIHAMSWTCFPRSIVAALSAALQSRHGAFAPYADELWIKFGKELLSQPAQFLKIASRYTIIEEKGLLELLAFISAHNVLPKEQSSEWITEVLSALSAKSMVECTASNHIDLRRLTFIQRTKVFRKLLRDERQGELFKVIPYQIDDLDQLKAEAMDRRTLEHHCSELEFRLLNLGRINLRETPKNFPAVLASLYFDYFDGLIESAIVKPSRWPEHEQIYLKTFRAALSGLIDNTKNENPSFLFTTGPVFQKAVLTAILNLYASCLKKDEASSRLITEDLVRINQAHLAGYFDQDRSADFALIRAGLRQSHQRLLSLKNGGPLEQEDLSAQTQIEKLHTPLPRSEEGRYYAMYAFQEMVFEFGGLVTAPLDQAREQRRSTVVAYIQGLWSLVHEEIIHHHHIFNTLLLYLQAQSAQFELKNIPAAHPQAVL